jgi:exodeoxyribonuclease VII small subunit
MEELTFEQAFAALEETVRQLELGDLPLAEALALFERGAKLAELCERQLNEAELRVRQLVPDASGGYESVPFAPRQTESFS